MIKPLTHAPSSSPKKSIPATLVSHKESCVGMAADMIGVSKRIIAFLYEIRDRKSADLYRLLNHEIIKKDGADYSA